MFPEIQSALRLDKHSIQNKRITLVQELSIDGSFLLHHFISSAVKSNFNILIVALEQTLGHFHGVGMKLGYDLLKCQKKGQLIFYDVLKSAHLSYLNDPQNNSNTNHVLDFHSESSKTLNELFKVLKAKVEEFTDKSKPLIIIIDKLSLFLSLGVKLSQVIKFTQSLQMLAEEKDASLGNIQKLSIKS